MPITSYSEFHGRRSYRSYHPEASPYKVSVNPSAHPAHNSMPLMKFLKRLFLNLFCIRDDCDLLVKIIIILILFFCYVLIPALSTPEPAKKSCPDHFVELSKNFSKQDEHFWPAVRLGIEGVLEDKSRPSIITFLYNDKRSLEVFRGIVDVTRKCINSPGEPIVLTGEELNGENVQADHGIIIEKYKPQLEDRQIMLVEDLQNISAVSSRVFHDICDTNSPIVERYVVYFTLIYTEEDRKASETASDLASNLLKRLWDDKISPDVAAALISRVTDQTLFLNAP